MRASLVLLTLACAGCAALQPNEAAQRAASADMYPAKIDRGPKHPGPLRTLRIRAWAEEPYRRLVLGWQVRFYELIQRSSAFFAHRFGVKLELVELRDWPPPAAGASYASMEGALSALAKLDAAQDVDLVVGLLSPLPLVENAIHELGMARLLGKHLVVRGMDQALEYEQITRIFGLLAADDHEELYKARTRHKELVVFIHELGHLLGGVHTLASDDLLYPYYDAHMRQLAPANARLIQLVLDARLATTSTLAARLADDLRAALALPDTSLDDRARLWLLQRLGGGTEELAAQSDRELAPRPGAERDPYELPSSQPSRPPRVLKPQTLEEELFEIQSAAAQGEHKTAWALLAPLAEKRPEDPRVQSMACQIGALADKTGPDAAARCQRARKLAPTDPIPALYAAFLGLESAPWADTMRLAQEAEERLRQAKGATPEMWSFLSQLYQQVHAVTLAERASDRVLDVAKSKAVREWAKKARRTYGLDPDHAGVPAERESEYVAGQVALQQAARVQDLAAAERTYAELERAFPAAAIDEMPLCELLARQRSSAEARRCCARVIGRAPNSPRPHVLLGFLALAERRVLPAMAELERAVELQSEDPQAYRLLHNLYSNRKDAKRRAQLEALYAQRFGEVLGGR